MAVLTARGYTGPGGGRESYVEAPPEWRGSSVQVCGLWPFAVGAGSPTVGSPLGHRIGGSHGGRSMCYDPISWFLANLQLNPSMFVLGLPALGKSTMIRRLVICSAGAGIPPLILGDLKPDYVDVIRALGGHVAKVGRGHGAINPLDVGAMDDAARRLDAAGRPGEADRLREEAHGRRVNGLRALITVVRGHPTADYEDTVLSVALRLLIRRYERSTDMPLIGDLITLIEEGPADVRAVAIDRGDETRYRDVVDPLLRSLMALVDGPLGSMFARPTTERLSLDNPGGACFDVSGISNSDSTLQSAALLACWSEGYGTVEAANALADAGIEPQRRFFIVLDELWRPLRRGNGLVDRVDELTRLNRNEGVGQAMITHSLADMRAVASEQDREKARGFVERSGAVICGGLPRQELADLQDVVAFTDAERDMISAWSTPAGWSELAEPPGRGNFILKVGQRPGVPFHVDLTGPERGGFNNTNKRWSA